MKRELTFFAARKKEIDEAFEIHQHLAGFCKFEKLDLKVLVKVIKQLTGQNAIVPRYCFDASIREYPRGFGDRLKTFMLGCGYIHPITKNEYSVPQAFLNYLDIVFELDFMNDRRAKSLPAIPESDSEYDDQVAIITDSDSEFGPNGIHGIHGDLEDSWGSSGEAGPANEDDFGSANRI